MPQDFQTGFDGLSLIFGLALGALVTFAALVWPLLRAARKSALAEGLDKDLAAAKAALKDKEDDYLSLLEAHGALKEQKKALEEARDHMTNQFKALSQDALSASAEHFLKLAQERFKQWDGENKGDLEKRRASIDEMVKPMQKQLETLAASLEQIKGTDTALSDALKNLQSETSKIAGAMHNPASRGKWGEYILERLLERSGLVKDVHFEVQASVQGEGKIQRPDVVIHLQDGMRIIIDSKAPIQDVLDDLSEATKEKELAQRLATQVRKHVTDLSKKEYQASMNSPDFVVLFLPAEHLFSMAVGADPSLIDYAAEKNIVLASPILIMSVLRVVRMSWQQSELADNAREIATAGAEMHKRLLTFTNHLSSLGKSVQSAVNHYNSAIGSFDHSVLPQARRFESLQAAANKALPDLTVIDTAARGAEGMITGMGEGAMPPLDQDTAEDAEAVQTTVQTDTNAQSINDDEDNTPSVKRLRS